MRQSRYLKTETAGELMITPGRPAKRLPAMNNLPEIEHADLVELLVQLSLDGKLEEIGSRAASLPRGTVLLYPNRKPKSDASPAFTGIIRLHDKSLQYVMLWPRTCKGKAIFEIKLVPKI